MTEQEWKGCTDSLALLKWVTGRTTKRKLKLFACACCRRIWPLLTDERSRAAVETAERRADGHTSDEELFAAYESAGEAKHDAWGGAYENVDFPASAAAHLLAHEIDVLSVASDVALSGENPKVHHKMEYAAQAQLLRCILGNPFRPVTINQASLTWNDGTVRRIAQSIYDERAFDRLPILADALQDAGCDNEDILSHCRSAGPHVRGCWVVDLLLGKT